MQTPPPNWVDVADLRTQQRIAELAQSMLELGYWQLVLGIAGTIALLWTVRESRRATSAALASVVAQQESQRAVMVIEKVQMHFEDRDVTYPLIKHPPGQRFYDSCSIKFKNAGHSVALVRRAIGSVFIGTDLPPTPAFPPLIAREHHPVEPGQSMSVPAVLTPHLDEEDHAELDAGQSNAWFYGFVEYDDVFGRRHRLGYCYRYAPNGQPTQDGGGAYWSVPKAANKGFLAKLGFLQNNC